MMLLSWGAPLIPAGGSCCRRLKSLISLFLAGVDILTAYTSSKEITSAQQAHKLLKMCIETLQLNKNHDKKHYTYYNSDYSNAQSQH